MSGHSKWSKIKRDKGANDAKRGAVFTKLGNQIAIAARAGVDPDMNPSLAMAIEKARDELLHRTKGKPLSAEDAACAGVIRELGGILGVFFRSLAEVETEALTITGRVRGGETLTRESVRALLDQRIEARKQKDFAAADAARAKLTSLGIEVLDSADGAQWRIATAAA